MVIDATAASTRMALRYGWAPRGRRCRLPVPCGHDKTTPVTAALRTSGLTATAVFEGAANGRRFLDQVTDTLVPALRPGDTVILDNLQAIAAAGARVVYLPPYSAGCAVRPGSDGRAQTGVLGTPLGIRERRCHP